LLEFQGVKTTKDSSSSKDSPTAEIWNFAKKKLSCKDPLWVNLISTEKIDSCGGKTYLI
jgi:hypothetical protein